MRNVNNEVSARKSLREYCRNATNREGDTFVGIRTELAGDKHEIQVHFPIGFNISQEDEAVRNEILDLVSVLQEYGEKSSSISQLTANQALDTVRFPVQAYLRVMHYYLQHGYYKELEEAYVPGTSGPVSMKVTINRVQPIVQKSGFVYPTLMVRKKNDTDKQIITEINRYCVYESFLKLGWLYKYKQPQPANQQRPNLKVYQSVLKQKLAKLNNDKLKQLFQSMLAIIEYRNSADNPELLYVGTNHFEYIWEKLIDETYGVSDKENYFPKTTWRLAFNSGNNGDKRTISPDAIMKTENHISVLDAKYYKYGVTGREQDLPETSSILKQIAYGEYIAKNSKFEEERRGRIISNAFLMPFNKEQNSFGINDNYASIGEAVADWKHSNKDYERVQGILVDVKMIITNKTRPSMLEIRKLSTTIEESLSRNEQNRNEG